MAIDFDDVDFFGAKLLDGKDADFYVRDGQPFMYVDGERFDFNNESEADSEPLEGPNGIRMSKLDVSRDMKEEGHLWMWQKEEYYVLCFLSHEKGSPPKILKAGNALQE